MTAWWCNSSSRQLHNRAAVGGGDLATNVENKDTGAGSKTYTFQCKWSE